METIGAFEAKTHFSALLGKVENGESIVITKHGRPVARLVPAFGRDSGAIRDSIARIKDLSRGNRLMGLDWKSLRDEGRK